jgi:hypothetical protein
VEKGEAAARPRCHVDEVAAAYIVESEQQVVIGA